MPNLPRFTKTELFIGLALDWVDLMRKDFWNQWDKKVNLWALKFILVTLKFGFLHWQQPPVAGQWPKGSERLCESCTRWKTNHIQFFVQVKLQQITSIFSFDISKGRVRLEQSHRCLEKLQLLKKGSKSWRWMPKYFFFIGWTSEGLSLIDMQESIAT